MNGELRTLAVGVHQIKLGKFYAEKHFRGSGLYKSFILKERNDIIISTAIKTYIFKNI